MSLPPSTAPGVPASPRRLPPADEPARRVADVPSWVRRVFMVLLPVAVVVATVALFSRGHFESWRPWTLIGLQMGATALLTIRAFRVPFDRLPWRLLLAALLCVAAAEILLTTGVSQSSSGLRLLTEILHGIFVLLSFAFLAALFRGRLPPIGSAVYLDGLIALLGVLSVGSALVTGPVNWLTHNHLSAMSRAVAYPISLLALVGLLVGCLTMLGRRPSAAWWLLTGGFALGAVADAALIGHLAVANRPGWRSVDVLWPVAITMLAWAAWLSPAAGSRARKVSVLSLVGPSVCIIGALAVVAINEVRVVSPLAVWLALVTLVFGALRLLLVVRVVGRMHRRQRELSGNLAEARDDALAAAAVKAAFLASMSHEIRTPMNAVIGMTGLLLETNLDATQREYAEAVRRSGDILLDVINDILDFSKIEAGELELEERSFDLVGVVEDAVGLLAIQADAKNLQLYCDVSDQCPAWVSTDPVRLRQVLVNLIGNAVKFTQQGHVTVAVRPIHGGPSGDVLLFEVTDTGIGIPADRLDRLFRPFTQIDASTTRLYGGTGLGLAISRALVEAMGGRIDVRSTAGSGTTFAFSIPVGAAQRPIGDVQPGSDRLTGRTVLIVEDNPANAHILLAQTRRWGMVSSSAASAAEALQLAAATPPPAVAVLDMQLPDVDGATLAGLLHAVPGWRDVPLVLLTSLSRRLEPEARREFAAVLHKPARSAELRVALGGTVSGDAAKKVALGSPAPPRELRILLAEDNPVNRTVGRLVLAKAGYQVDLAEDGRQALQAVERKTYDAVLMDVHMPGMDGMQATRAIRALGETIHQPRIVALTADVTVEDRRECYAAGMDGHVSKPFRSRDLIELLTRLCGEDVPEAPAEPVEAVIPPEPAVDGTRLAPVVDLEQFHALLELGDGVSATVLERWESDTVSSLAQLHELVATGDDAAAGMVAHRIRGASATIGAAALAQTLAHIEDLGCHGSAIPPQKLRDLDDAVAQAIAAFGTLVASSEPEPRDELSV